MSNVISHSGYPRVRAFFVGGVGDDVTGSSTLIKITKADGTDEYGLIDAGSMQGKSEYQKNEYPLTGESISFVVLTHAHFDHIGLLPLLYKRGFRGKIYCSGTVKTIAYPLLTDGAKLNEIAAGVYGQNKKALTKTEHRLSLDRALATKPQEIRGYDAAIAQIEEMKADVLYSQEDVEGVMELFTPIELFTKTRISDEIYVRLLPTTHQNGACRVELYIGSGENRCNIAFSGDLGPADPLLYRYTGHFYNESINYFVLESLHGVEEPIETLKTSIKRLMEIIKKGIRQHKHIVLAGFSLDRNAILVYLMNEFRKQGICVDTYVDSPLTMRMLSIYDASYKADRYYFKNLGEKPFEVSHFHVMGKNREHVDSVLHGEAPRVIITASANGGGGRVVDFFENGIQREDYVFVFCGWINPDSPSSKLHEAKIGEMCEVGKARFIKKCKTYRLHGFSSHGYYPEMLTAISDYPNLDALILNHADRDVKIKLRERLVDLFERDIHVPERFEGYAFEDDGMRLMKDAETLLEFESIITMKEILSSND